MEETKPYGVIYFILNKINGKYYVGQTTWSMERRWKRHLACANGVDWKSTKNYHLYNAMRKYGIENFSIETLCECPDKESLDASETFFIWFLGSIKPSLGYNSKTGGANGSLSEEARDKLRQKMLGVPKSPEAIEKSAAKRRGRKASPETIEKGRLSHIGLKQSPEVCAAKSLRLKGKKQTPEQIAARVEGIRRANEERKKKGIESPRKGVPMPESQKEAIRVAARIKREKGIQSPLKGVPKTPEHCANISKGLIGKIVSPEARANMSKAQTGKKLSPESIAKRSLKQKGQKRRPRTEEEKDNIRKGMIAAKLRREKETLDKQNETVVQ